MMRNTIIDALHEARKKILAKYQGDTAAYLRDAQTRLEASDHKIWPGKQKSIRQTFTEQPTQLPIEHRSPSPSDQQL